MGNKCRSRRSANCGIKITQHLIITLPPQRLWIPLHVTHDCDSLSEHIWDMSGCHIPFGPPAPPRLRMSVGFRWLWLAGDFGVLRFLPTRSFSAGFGALTSSMREVRFKVLVGGGMGFSAATATAKSRSVRERCRRYIRWPRIYPVNHILGLGARILVQAESRLSAQGRKTQARGYHTPWAQRETSPPSLDPAEDPQSHPIRYRRHMFVGA